MNEYMDYLNQKAFDIIKPYIETIKYPTILDVACGKEPWNHLREHGIIYGIDPELSNLTPFNIKMKYQDISDRELLSQFDIIISKQFLEHEPDPDAYLEWAKKHANKYIITIIPNAKSTNRIIGSINGHSKSPYELTDNDISVGHVKMYDYMMLFDLFNKHFTHFTMYTVGWKPLPLSEMDKIDPKFYPQLDRYGEPLEKAWIIIIANVGENTQ